MQTGTDSLEKIGPDDPKERTQAEVDKLLSEMLDTGEKYVTALKQTLGSKPLQVSDIVSVDTDAAGNQYQYVNLVQEGGGMLGIALLGYTYVLERMGIRFLKLAGTSAGAINAMLLAMVRPTKPGQNNSPAPDPSVLKSPIIMYYLARRKLFSFVDGNALVKWLIKTSIGYSNDYKTYVACLLRSAGFVLAMSVGLILFSSLLLWNDGGVSIVGELIGLIVGFGLILLIFSGETNSNAVIGDYLEQPFFLRFLLSVVGILVAAWLIVRLLPGVDGQIIVGLVPIALAMGWAFWLTSKGIYLRFIQITVGCILAVVLANGIINSQHGVWSLSWPFLHFDDTVRPLPYKYLSIAGISLLLYLLLLVGSIAIFLVARFKDSGYGINPGDEFKQWITDLMADGEVNFGVMTAAGNEVSIQHSKNGIHTLADLETKLNQIAALAYQPDTSCYSLIPELELMDTNKLAGLDKYDPDDPSLALITTEIATENEIMFPKMWKLFYEDSARENAAKLSPAAFVRASMSIPVFFQAFRVKNIPNRDTRKLEWTKYLRYDQDKAATAGTRHTGITEAVFVDGGSLSNFPINVFNPTKASVPRLPTFGARLQDQDPESSRSVQSLEGIAGSIINTMRAHFDKDFLITHPQYDLALAEIDVRRFNWLDFDMPIPKQIALFEQGAKAAADFLAKFDWNLYKAKQVALNVGVQAAEVRVANTVQEIAVLMDNMRVKRGITTAISPLPPPLPPVPIVNQVYTLPNP